MQLFSADCHQKLSSYDCKITLISSQDFPDCFLFYRTVLYNKKRIYFNSAWVLRPFLDEYIPIDIFSTCISNLDSAIYFQDIVIFDNFPTILILTYFCFTFNKVNLLYYCNKIK